MGANCLPNDMSDSNYIIYHELGAERRTLQYNIKEGLVTSGCFKGTRAQHIEFYQNKYAADSIHYKQYTEVFKKINYMIVQPAGK